MLGRPKYSDKDLHDKFNAKEYVLQLGSYFSNKLTAIQDKINNLKTLCKPTQDFAMQCFPEAQAEVESHARA
jgi:hypothetical protein